MESATILLADDEALLLIELEGALAAANRDDDAGAFELS